MQMGHIYFEQFLFMQGNLNINTNVALTHIDVAGIHSSHTILTATADILQKSFKWEIIRETLFQAYDVCCTVVCNWQHFRLLWHNTLLL